MTENTVTDRPRCVEWRRPERSQQAFAALRNPFAAMLLSFSHGFSAAC
jgi:hypothetical protein